MARSLPSLALVVLAVSCAPAPPAPSAPVASSPVPAVAPPAASASATAVASAPPPAAPPPPAPVDAPKEVDLGAFTRSLDVPVTSLALGEPRVAVLGPDPWILEKGAWKKIALPDRIRPAEGERHEGRIFFGRDDRPRIMGTRHRPAGPSQLYLRYRNERWNEERAEIAKLRDPPPQGMWGVLGHADPEVVCKVGDECIIKRRTGWKMMPAGTAAPRVELHGGVAWAIHPDAVARLDGDSAWLPLRPPAPFVKPGGVWGTKDEVWVSSPTTDELHRFHGGAWTTIASPVAGPRGMWASSPSDVWLAGAGGLAHFDGTSWSRVAGPKGPLAEVYGRDGEIWAAGESGVWVRAGSPSAKPAHL